MSFKNNGNSKNVLDEKIKDYTDSESESDHSGDSDIESDTNEEIETVDSNKNMIHLFGEVNGRHTNTYIAGWTIQPEEMKEHLKKLKKRLGCNGSVKDIKYEGVEQPVLHLQGNKIDECASYLTKELGLKNLYIKRL